MKILVLCHGNINRSPLATAVLRAELGSDHEVRTAALKPDWHRAERATLKMREAAASLGYNLEEHRSQPCTQELVDWADVAVIFDERNWRLLTANFSRDRKMPCHVTHLSEWLTPPREKISDPAYFQRGGPELMAVVHDIVTGAKRMAWHICNPRSVRHV